MQTPGRSLLVMLVVCATLALAGPSVGAGALDTSSRWSPPSWRWRRVSVRVGGAGEGLVAVAAQPGNPARVAVADLDGVSLRVDGGSFRFAARVAGVTDLAFAPNGDLWIGSVSGLWLLDGAGRLRDRSPAPGELARAIHRVRVSGDAVAVGTEAGAWVRGGDSPWRRLADGLPLGPVTALAFHDDRLWLVVGEDVWYVGLAATAHARRVPISGAPSGVAPTDIVVGLPASEVTVVYPRALAMGVTGVAGEGASARAAFRLLRPAWPPGAVARRLTAGAGRVWLATDLGLLSASGLAGPWRRAEAPAGSAAIRSIAGGSDDAIFAATGLGLLHGAPVLLARTRAAVGSGRPEAPLAPADPDVRAVHAASLRYLDLGPERMRDLHAGIRRRGWLPTLSLQLGAARDRAWQTDYDEAFVSGDTRRLNDREKDRSLDLEANLVMTWSLGDLAFDDDAIDLSREHRQIVSLRDNVIDEINQLYFERRGLLERMRDDDLPPDFDRRGALRRAAELAAGLDAWTGGWFSRQPPRPEHAHPPNGLRPIQEETR